MLPMQFNWVVTRDLVAGFVPDGKLFQAYFCFSGKLLMKQHF
jgi:hypothetical protein